MTIVESGAGQPDILEVIADLSNDEVFTPPAVARAVLDLLPDEVWSDPTLRWLDPGTKTGVFLREITRRLMVGLADAFPDEQQRLAHILQNMVFGVAITELTALMSRRTLYCSKDASGDVSAVEMPTSAGNIWFERIDHEYENGRCRECGASAAQLDRGEGRENYAYGFIHAHGLASIEEAFGMKFDVIVGNPPYQMEADEAGQNVVPIYHLFVEQALQLTPRYLTMVTPSRWMSGGRRLGEFRARMLTGGHLRALVDYPNAGEIFPGVEIKGGVAFFLWNQETGTCASTLVRGKHKVGPIERNLERFDVHIRDPRAVNILEKVLSRQEQSFSSIVSTRDPFGPALSSNFKDFTMSRSEGDYLLFMNEGANRVQRWVAPRYVTRNLDVVGKWKIFIPEAGSDGGQRIPDVVIGRPVIAPPQSVCTLTYLFLGPFEAEDEALSADSYIRTRFFRFLVSLRKITQHAPRSTYEWVPIQSWDRTWSDSELFDRYDISSDEQRYIEEMVKEMPA